MSILYYYVICIQEGGMMGRKQGWRDRGMERGWDGGTDDAEEGGMEG